MNKKRLLPVLIILIMIFALAVAGAQDDTTDDKPRFLQISEEYYLGRVVAAKLISEYGLVDNTALTDYISAVGNTLAMASSKPSTFHGYTFGILDTDTEAAYTCPDGFIFITRGLLNKADNEDELAALIAVQVAHIVNNLPVRLISPKSIDQLNATFNPGEDVSVEKDDVVALFGSFVDEFYGIVTGKFKYPDCLQNDLEALTIMTVAGYSQKALGSILGKLSKKGHYAKSRPGANRRIKALKKALSGQHVYKIDRVRTERFKKIMSESGG